MIKSLLLFLFPMLMLMNNSSLVSVGLTKENSYLTFSIKSDDTYIIDGISDDSLNEYRLYSLYEGENYSYEVSEIDDHVFDDIDHDIVVLISKDITSFSVNLFNNQHISNIYYTGSEAHWNSRSINPSQNVYFYQGDEGFINYWNDAIRPTSSSDVCLMSKEDYTILKSMYDSLTAADKLVVNTYLDKANQTIEDTMVYLSKYFSNENKSNNQPKKNLPQDMTIGIIVSVAIFGMTTICIFYILKRQGIIK